MTKGEMPPDTKEVIDLIKGSDSNGTYLSPRIKGIKGSVTNDSHSQLSLIILQEYSEDQIQNLVPCS